jgi:hypothetical protein
MCSLSSAWGRHARTGGSGVCVSPSWRLCEGGSATQTPERGFLIRAGDEDDEGAGRVGGKGEAFCFAGAAVEAFYEEDRGDREDGGEDCDGVCGVRLLVRLTDQSTQFDLGGDLGGWLGRGTYVRHGVRLNRALLPGWGTAVALAWGGLCSLFPLHARPMAFPP